MELGVMIDLYEDTDFPAAFWYAKAAGFTRGQITSFIHGITAEQVREIAVAARNIGFWVDAVGCYLNPLRLDDTSLHGVDGADWRTLAENMGMMNGVERLVCWSGTRGKSLGTPNLLNQEEETFTSLYSAIEGLLEMVRGLPIQIILEPYTAHVLSDPAACVRLARLFPRGDVKMVLDAPNFLSAKAMGAREDRLASMIAEMAPTVGLVHLRDLALGDNGKMRFLRAGAGSLDYAAYLRAIAHSLPEVPVIVEQVTTVEEMRAAREFVQGIAAECRL